MAPIETSLTAKYQRLRGGLPSPAALPGPEVLAALWAEQLCAPRLRLADGRTVEVLQPGLPERPGALRFVEAALRFDGGEPRTGPVTVGIPEEGALLSLAWKGGSGATAALETQLLVPWEEAEEALELPAAPPAPRLREEPPPSSVPVARRLELARAAGLYRLERRARRLALREKAAGRTQLLWEEAAGALGYHANQAPFRHLARRLPAAFLRAVPEGEQEVEALLFGVAGFLPGEKLGGLSPAARALARTLWDRWWKARAALDHAVLPASAWTVARVRPANRPERRLAALARLLPHLDRLERAVSRRDAAAFARVLAELHDPFWSRHATWKSRPAAKPSSLVGPERIDALLGNLFWPLVARDDPAAARTALERLGAGGSRAEREGWERLFGSDLPPRSGSALVRQGILQLRRDAPDAASLSRLAGGW